MPEIYAPKHLARSALHPLRGGQYHTWHWHDDVPVTPDQPLLVLCHGWMDVGASFQFMVDAMARPRRTVALDWRGFGHSTMPPTDSYWFPDYVGDLDALLDQLAPGQAVDLVGHSMGGNVVMTYAGARPERIRKLINLEGFGMPQTRPHEAPKRLRAWLDELKSPQAMRPYASPGLVAHRLMKNNARLPADKAQWLAQHWSDQREDGQWHILGDAAHKRVNPILYRVDENQETWKCITAPLLWVEGAQTDTVRWWGTRYSVSEFHQRLAVMTNVEKHVLPDCGHMLHHDQPEALARRLDAFLDSTT